MKFLSRILTSIHPAFWAAMIVLNTVMIMMNISLEDNDAAGLAFLSALGCWVGFFQSKFAREEKNDSKDNE